MAGQHRQRGPTSRVTGVTQLLAIKLAERLGKECVALSNPVQCIRRVDGIHNVTADGLTVKSKHVVAAMSSPLTARIIYDPILPARRDQLT
jgi:monoamine oxidase